MNLGNVFSANTNAPSLGNTAFGTTNSILGNTNQNTTAATQGFSFNNTTNSQSNFPANKSALSFGNPSTTSSLGFGNFNSSLGTGSNAQINNPTISSLTQNQNTFGNANTSVPSLGNNAFGTSNSVFGNSPAFGSTATSTTLGTSTNTFGAPLTTNTTSTTGLTTSTPFQFGAKPTNVTTGTFSTTCFGLPQTSTTLSTPLALNLSSTTVPKTTPLFGQTSTSNTTNSVTVKGLGGIPSQNTVAANKTELNNKDGVKNAKDMDLQPEIRDTLNDFKKYMEELKKSREEILKNDELQKLIARVNEEGRQLSNSITEVANGLQMIQIQSSRIKNDIKKEKLNIKISKMKPEYSYNLGNDHCDFIPYLSNKLREFENRIYAYKQEIELIESLICSLNMKQNNAEITPRELVEIMHRLDTEFLNVAAELYTLTERMKQVKQDHIRRLKSEYSRSSSIGGVGGFQDPFQAIEGRFSDPLFDVDHKNGSINRDEIRSPSKQRRRISKLSEGVGSSPFEQPNTHGMLMIGGGVSFCAANPTNKPFTGILGSGNSGSITTPLPFGGNTSGGFGATSQASTVKPTSLFGTTANTTNTGSIFGNQSTTGTPSLFGTNTNNIASTNQNTGFSFPQSSVSPTKPTSLFGASQQNTFNNQSNISDSVARKRNCENKP